MNDASKGGVIVVVTLMEPRYPNIDRRFVGEDGKRAPLNILGLCQRAMRKAGLSKAERSCREHRGLLITTFFTAAGGGDGRSDLVPRSCKPCLPISDVFLLFHRIPLGHNNVGRAAEGQDGGSAEVVLI